jgi:hypothetical protein
VCTPNNTYQLVVLESNQVVLELANGNLCSYRSVEEMKGDIARVLADKLVDTWIYWEGAVSERLVQAEIRKVD